MLRKSLCLAVAFALCAAVATAADEKPEPKSFSGKIKKIDAEKGLLVVTTTTGDKTKDMVVKIDDDTTIMIPSAKGPPSKATGKGALKAKELVVGASVIVMPLGPGKKMVALMPRLLIGPNRHQEMLQGTIKKADAEKGVLILSLKTKGEDTDKEIKLTDDVEVIKFMGKEGPKKLTGKAALKEKDLLKPGARVMVSFPPDGKTMIVLGGPDGIGPSPKRIGTVVGKIKKVDAEKGTLVATVDGKNVEITPTEETKFVIAGSKPLDAKEAFKKEEFQEGASIRITKNPKGEVIIVMSVKSKVEKPKLEKPKDE